MTAAPTPAAKPQSALAERLAKAKALAAQRHAAAEAKFTPVERAQHLHLQPAAAAASPAAEPVAVERRTEIELPGTSSYPQVTGGHVFEKPRESSEASGQSSDRLAALKRKATDAQATAQAAVGAKEAAERRAAEA